MALVNQAPPKLCLSSEVAYKFSRGLLNSWERRILKSSRQEGAGIGGKVSLLCKDEAKASDITMGTANPEKEVGWSRSRKAEGEGH